MAHGLSSKCSNCGHDNRASAKFCEQCAAPLVRVCAHCGLELSPTARFCPECAHPVEQGGAPRSPRFAAPAAYTPRHLAHKILASKAALEGERKHVTVLFADLKGSMELLAARDPEEARKFLDPVVEHMMEAVHHYEGTVTQIAGDGIMALFGAPVAHEDHAVRACYAALRMQERVKRHAEAVFDAHGVNPQIRVGLNSGEVVVGVIGSDLRMDYTAIGRTTHLASRMEQLARPGTILLTPSTFELAEGFVTATSLGTVPVKGLAEPLEVHEVTGVGLVQTRLQVRARRGLTRFVGRDAELEQLQWARQRARDGHGQVAALVAEAGVGKSRLVYEFTHAHGLEGWLVLECAAVSYGTAMSYLPVVDLLKSYFGIGDRDSLQAIGDKVAGRLRALDPAFEPMLPPLLALLDAPVNEPQWQTLDPAQRRRRMLDAVRHLLLREARKQPLLLIVEDLHWIDGETQALLDGLVENLGAARILLLATYRPEYQHGWASKPFYSQVRLDALASESAAKLLAALLGEDPTLAPLKQSLARHANPFFLEETVRTLVETKVLEGSSGHYRVGRPIEAIQVPATVQVMLAARIDRLSPEDKRLLQVAAVVGKQSPFSLLRVVAELPDEAMRGALDRLQAAGFVHETGLFPDLEYSFRHALTQDVAYGGMLQEPRRELHARTVNAIETLYHDRLGEQVELLAHHALHGELRERAVSYLLQAGLKAARHSAPRAAASWYEKALLVLETLPDSRDKLEKSFDIRIQMRVALSNLGEARRALQYLREAEGVAETLNDEQKQGLVSALMATTSCIHGELDQALARGRRALAIAERIGDSKLRVATESGLTLVHYYRGEYARVVELATANLSAMPDGPGYYTPSVPGRIYVCYWLIKTLIELGRFAEAGSHADEALRLSRLTQAAYDVGQAHLAAGWLGLAKGDWAQARLHIERVTAEYRRGDIFLALPHAVASSAVILAQLGETDEALSRLREGEERLERLTSIGTIGQAGMDYQWLGHAALLLARPDDARRMADCSLQCSPSHPGFAAHALQLLGDIATQPDRFDAGQGEIHYREALALAQSLNMRPLIAHCHLGLGKLYRRVGKQARANEHLKTATTMYRQMDMRFYLEQAETRSRGQT